MNKNQKLVQEAFLKNEEKVINKLKNQYSHSLKEITNKTKALQDEINKLDAMVDMTEDEERKKVLKSMQQSKIYQKQYQDAMKKQIGSILDTMQVEEFKTVSSYLQTCYEDGFIGTMYDLQGQGIPLCFPLDQEAMVRAVQTDSKISQGLYTKLGEDVSMLKKKITAQISRGISTGMRFEQVAQQLASVSNIGFNNAVRIARTEGHRIQVQSGMDACYKAKEKGADVVKQWDATLDDTTRESHQQVDGEIRELDKPFSNGLMFPGDPSGGAAEVINCRCALLQRARWALDEDELQTLQDRAAFYGLDKTKSFEDFKQKYLKMADDEYQEKIRTRRELWKQRKANSTQETNLSGFDDMDIKQLEEYASKHLQTDFEGLKGANTEYVREAVKVIDEFENKLGKTTIDGLSVKFGGVPQGVLAKYDDKTKTLLVKKSGSKVSFEEKLKNDNVRARRKLGRDYHATETYSGTLWHEIGHAVDMDTGETLSKKLSNSKELELKSVEISVSARATQNVRVSKRSEAWAENFAAYMEGGTKKAEVPPEIAEMIEGYFKKKR